MLWPLNLLFVVLCGYMVYDAKYAALRSLNVLAMIVNAVAVLMAFTA